jgi:hypothetical protein
VRSSRLRGGLPGGESRPYCLNRPAAPLGRAPRRRRMSLPDNRRRCCEPALDRAIGGGRSALRGSLTTRGPAVRSAGRAVCGEDWPEDPTGGGSPGRRNRAARRGMTWPRIQYLPLSKPSYADLIQVSRSPAGGRACRLPSSGFPAGLGGNIGWRFRPRAAGTRGRGNSLWAWGSGPGPRRDLWCCGLYRAVGQGGGAIPVCIPPRHRPLPRLRGCR